MNLATLLAIPKWTIQLRYVPTQAGPFNAPVRYDRGEQPVYPRAIARQPLRPDVIPPKIAQDYIEACLVLADSPKASAALSRRCLQTILREHAKVKPQDLSKEIEEALASKQLP